MAFTRLSIDTSKPSPEACLEFSRPLVDSPDTRYSDYLRLTPDPKPAVRVDGRQLCLAGLQLRQTYRVTLLAGLPAASGERSAEPEDVSIDFGDRPPLLSFSDSGFILPRQGTAGVGIDTINVEKLKLKVLRVGERSMVRELRESLGERSIYSYAVEELENERAATVWTGEMDIVGQHNQRVTTVIPLADMIRERKPGAYLIIADNAAQRASGGSRYYRQLTTQWVIDTDLALTTLKAADGLTVVLRSLDTAKPVAGASIVLVAQNNEELARLTSDASGRVTFPPGLMRGTKAMTPSLVTAYAGDDFTVLDLKRAAFDLSDRGVAGRAVPGPIDPFLYTDRGIYRPGETVQLAALLRDRTATAIDGTRVTFTFARPDGQEVMRSTVDPQPGGAYYLPYTLSRTAPRGMWSVTARLDAEGPALGRAEFDVQDFVPQRMKVEARLDKPRLTLEEPFEVAVEGRFLYGAPAAELAGEAEVKLRPEPEPFPQWRGYRFGLVDDKFTEQTVALEIGDTDAEGRTKATGMLTKITKTTLPLRASIAAGLFEPGGRITRDGLTVPVRSAPLWIGIKPRFAGNRVEEGTEAVFDLVALDGDGKAVERKGVRYELVQEITDYTWFRQDGNWRWQTTVRDRALASGRLDIAADQPAMLRQTVQWGRYRLALLDTQTGAATSLRFNGGWAPTTEAEDTPDKVEVSLSDGSRAPGDMARLSIKPPVAGELMVTVASDRIFEVRNLTVPAEGTVIEVPITADWGSGAYVMATLYRPLAQGRPRDPVRAVGLAWVPVDAGPRTLGVELGAPERIAPRQRIEVPVTVTGFAAGDPVHLTLAAVDEGILQLTRFKSPDPVGWYYGKRRLAVDVRDDYSKLLDGNRGDVGRLREGGDGMGGAGLDVVPTKSVALFSGILTVDATGRLAVPIDVPDFNGQLRLMAVAFSRTQVGRAEARLTVRDPVVAEATLPRFLAPEDESRITLLMHNVDGAAGRYRVTVTTEGAVALTGAYEQEWELAAGARRIETIPLRGRDLGIGRVMLAVSGPGFQVTRDWPIQVRSPFQPVTLEQVAQQAPGTEFTLPANLLAPFRPGSAKVSVNYSLLNGIDVPGLLQSLDRYPYGCTEQIVSRALPLLYFDEVARATGAVTEGDSKTRLQEAVDRLIERQNEDGDFGLWRAGDSAGTAWLGVFASDFLARARDAGLVVPQANLRRNRDWLQKQANGDSTDGTAAYAYYLLARAGAANLGDLRYFADTKLRQLSHPMAQAQMGAALMLAGDRARADEAFQRAARQPGRNDDKEYATALRDVAAVIALAMEHGHASLLPELVTRLERLDRRVGSTSTQEQGWMLLAAKAMLQGNRPLELAVNGLVRAGLTQPTAFQPGLAEIGAGYSIVNRGPQAVWRTLVVTGAPVAAPRPMAAGFTLQKKLYNLAGEAVTATTMQQNDRLVVSLSGKATDKRLHRAVLVDLLPAGWEIEAMVQRTEEGQELYDWLPKISITQTREARDDRFVAAFTLNDEDNYNYRDDEDKQEFHVAYIVRATAPGSYTLPAAVLEDMYRPGVTARTATGTMVITQRR